MQARACGGDHVTEEGLGVQGGERTHPAHTALVSIWFRFSSFLVLNLGFFAV